MRFEFDLLLGVDPDEEYKPSPEELDFVQNAQDIDDCSVLEEEIEDLTAFLEDDEDSSETQDEKVVENKPRDSEVQLNAVDIIMKSKKNKWTHVFRGRNRRRYGPDHRPYDKSCDCTQCVAKRSQSRSRYSLIAC